MTRATRRKRIQAWGAAAGATAGLLLAVGCTSAPLPSPSQQAAQDTRAAVAREYWRMLAVIVSRLYPVPGALGQFATCQPASGSTPTQVAYTIENDLLPQGGRIAPAPFASQLAQLLRTHGWSGFTAPGGAAMAGRSGSYRLQLQPVPDKPTVSVALTLTGPCVTVGAAFAKAAPTLKLHDTYANADVTSSPTPTEPLPTP